MLFRLWYHACQLAILAILGGMIGLVANVPVLVDAVTWVTVPVGVAGAVLGVIGVTTGIRSACPNCGRKSTWLYARRFLGIDCDHCGIYGGYPMAHIVPFKVEVVDPTEAEQPNDSFEEWKK